MAAKKGSITETEFGNTRSGEATTLYTLSNKNGMTVKITNYGGTVTSLTAPDRDGQFNDVVLGFDTLVEYEAATEFFGALIGRYGNRIARGRFELDGEVYKLSTNNPPNHLHGGERGFDKVVWDARASMTTEGPALLLSYQSENGEAGYPGKLSTQVRYTLTNDNQLSIRYSANCDKATHVNLTNHCYFNLADESMTDVLAHQLTIYADYFTPVDSNLIPTGEYRSVEGTPFDFRFPTAVGSRIDTIDEQLSYGSGYDHNFVVNPAANAQLKCVASLGEPESGRVMEVHSTEPGVQLYSGNFLDGSSRGKGRVHSRRTGLCLETQHFPDSPNQPDFPSTVLRPGETYESQTVYSFMVGD